MIPSGSAVFARSVEADDDTTAGAPNAPTVCTDDIGTIPVSAGDVGANADGGTRARASSQRPAATAAHVDTGCTGGAGISATEDGSGAARAGTPEDEGDNEGPAGAPEERGDRSTPGPAGLAGKDAPTAVVSSTARAVGAARRWAPLVSRVGGGVGMREKGEIDVSRCPGWEGWSKEYRQSGGRD